MIIAGAMLWAIGLLVFYFAKSISALQFLGAVIAFSGALTLLVGVIFATPQSL